MGAFYANLLLKYLFGKVRCRQHSARKHIYGLEMESSFYARMGEQFAENPFRNLVQE
jgi:hypothetical protein